MHAFIRWGLPALFLMFITAGQVFAHKVHIFAYVDNGTVYTEGYFPDGKPVSGATVKAQDEDGREQAAGITDGQGCYSFPYSGHQDLSIVLIATMGHRGTFHLVMPKE